MNDKGKDNKKDKIYYTIFSIVVLVSIVIIAFVDFIVIPLSIMIGYENTRDVWYISIISNIIVIKNGINCNNLGNNGSIKSWPNRFIFVILYSLKKSKICFVL